MESPPWTALRRRKRVREKRSSSRNTGRVGRLIAPSCKSSRTGRTGPSWAVPMMPLQYRERHSEIPRVGYREALSRRLHEAVTSSTLHSPAEWAVLTGARDSPRHMVTYYHTRRAPFRALVPHVRPEARIAADLPAMLRSSGANQRCVLSARRMPRAQEPCCAATALSTSAAHWRG